VLVVEYLVKVQEPITTGCDANENEQWFAAWFKKKIFFFKTAAGALATCGVLT
jgi:hypothetical protein